MTDLTTDLHEVMYGTKNGNQTINRNPTDLGNAERLIDLHGEDLRYVHAWRKWLVWSGVRWEIDGCDVVKARATETVRNIYHEAGEAKIDGQRKELANHARKSESQSRIEAMLSLAEHMVAVKPEDLDSDPWQLNVENGTVDLRTGELRPHRREDRITKLAPLEYDPAATAPTFEAFLEQVLPSENLRTFVQRGAGYSATGDTSEQCLFINHGGGNNGKSTFQEVIGEALGDYAMRTPTETLMVKRSGGVPNDVARLKGQRFVAASETEEGKRLAESLIKDLTGQDTVSARFMRAEWFDFKPTHKLWLSTNHKPEIRGTDNAIWRRIRLIPWDVTVPPAERDRKLPEKLRAELVGVLAWIVRGCLEWQSEGLKEADEVRKATASYRGEMDTLGAFLKDRCVVAPHVEVPATPLYEAYVKWCVEGGEERAENQRRFGTRLGERGFEKEKVGGLVKWFGIGLRADDPGPSGGGEGPEQDLQEDKGPGDEKPIPTGENHHGPGPSGPSGPKTHINSSNYAHEEVMCKKGPKGPKGPADEPDDAYDRMVEERSASLDKETI